MISSSCLCSLFMTKWYALSFINLKLVLCQSTLFQQTGEGEPCLVTRWLEREVKPNEQTEEVAQYNESMIKVLRYRFALFRLVLFTYIAVGGHDTLWRGFRYCESLCSFARVVSTNIRRRQTVSSISSFFAGRT